MPWIPVGTAMGLALWAACLLDTRAPRGPEGRDPSWEESNPALPPAGHGFFGPAWNFLGGLCRQSYWFSLCFCLTPRARGESARPRAHTRTYSSSTTVYHV